MSTSVSLHGRSFLKESDFTAAELNHLLDVAAAVKTDKAAGRRNNRLAGRNVALIFEKSSTRTRCAFEVATYDEGGHTTYLDPQSSQLGHKESIADTARVLSRFYDAIEFRGSDHAIVEELAEHASVPIYNGLTDTWHPTQMLADFLTMREYSDARGADLAYCYLGDARNNMGNSLLMMGAILGNDVRIGAPRELWPDEAVQQLATNAAKASGAKITITDVPDEALSGAEFVHTDVWVSMGEPPETWLQRIDLLKPFRIDAAAMKTTGVADAKFMHCLPAYHDLYTDVGRNAAELIGHSDGIEVSSEVFESDSSVVFDQAENRMHSIKALLIETIGSQ